VATVSFDLPEYAVGAARRAIWFAFVGSLSGLPVGCLVAALRYARFYAWMEVPLAVAVLVASYALWIGLYFQLLSGTPSAARLLADIGCFVLSCVLWITFRMLAFIAFEVSLTISADLLLKLGFA
jgi:hypothetical protein